MRKAPEFRRPLATEAWRRCARRIVWVIVVGAVLTGCDRCGDLAFPGSSTACRQEAPKPH